MPKSEYEEFGFEVGFSTEMPIGTLTLTPADYDAALKASGGMSDDIIGVFRGITIRQVSKIICPTPSGAEAPDLFKMMAAAAVPSAPMDVVVVDRPREVDGAMPREYGGFRPLHASELAAVKAHYQGMLGALDKDGPHVPLPKREVAVKATEPLKHDFIAALHRPYVPPV